MKTYDHILNRIFLGLLTLTLGNAVAFGQGSHSEEDYRDFEKIRSSPYISSKNFLVPKRLSPIEAVAFENKTKALNEIREKIGRGAASREEIERYFDFRERTLNYRLQLVHQLYVERGGVLSKVDPNLDIKEIRDREVKKLYQEILNAQSYDYRQKREALKRIGLTQKKL